MGKVLTETVVIEHEPERVKVVAWRYEWLRHAGYSTRNAELLASSSIDLHFACDALPLAKAKGHDENFIMQLLL